MLDDNQGAVPALQRSLHDIVDEYTEKCVGAEAGEVRKRPGTAVSADLAFYWTPPAVIDEMISAMPVRAVDPILEPSCGDGRIMDGIVDHVRAERIENIGAGIFGQTCRSDRSAQRGQMSAPASGGITNQRRQRYD
jgi:hypothetical protein